MSLEIQNHASITCSHVEVAERPNILPRYAGSKFPMLEGLIYSVMGEYSDEYNGAYWEMWELSNGSFYMSPGHVDKEYAMSCSMNWYSGSMSANAAGVVVCLVAFSRMAFRTRDDRFSDLFHGLREWALDNHPEASKILRAID